MLSVIEAIFLGIVQGMTEFLPVSSSGHLVTLEKFMQLPGDHLGFNVSVHLGTLLSVLTLYRRTIGEILVRSVRGVLQKQLNSGLQLVFFVGIASIPTGLMGFLLRDYFKIMFASLHYVGVFFCLTATLLIFTRKKSGTPRSFADALPEELPNLNGWKALVIGVAQGLAIAPGISRSGTTIAIGLFLGLDRQLAALFSFLLMIPAILGATLLELKDMTWTSDLLPVMGLGLISAYFSGLLGLYLVLKTVKKGRLELFSPYLFAIGAFVLIYSFSN